MRMSVVSTAMVLAGFSAAMGSTGSNGAMPPGTQALIDAYPGVKANITDGRVRVLYGARMTSAATPDQAAEWFLADHADAFGIENLELALERSNSVNPQDRWTVFVYRQYVDGVPVEFGTARVVVANGSVNAVILASAKLATPPVDGFPADSVSAEAALEIAQSAYSQLSVWSPASLVVYYGEGDMEHVMSVPVRAWKLRGENSLSADEFEAYTLFINAADGSIVHVRNEVYHTDVTGTAHGLATPWLPKNNTYPDNQYHLPEDFVLEDVELSIVGGAKANANDDGTFVIPNDGDVDVSVQGKLIGPWTNVIDDTGPEHILSATVTPPGPWDAAFNTPAAELFTAQVNAMIHATNTHDFVVEHAPDFTALGQIQAHVNQNSTCNAFYTGNTINFYKKESGAGCPDACCPNTSYSSVVAHEYGHYIVNQLGLNQNAFGEGTGDAIGALMYNDPITARDFFAVGEHLRDPVAANKQYPCSDEIHECGMVVSGIWWDIHLNLGEDTMLPTVQQLYIDWMMITEGEQDSTDGMGPVNVPEVLGVADDDGNPETPGPYDDAICSAFVKHGITPCGDITILDFSYPNEYPGDFDGLPCDADSKFCIQITDGVLGVFEPGTAEMVYRDVTNQGAQPVFQPLVEISPNTFEGTIPALTEGVTYGMYFRAETTDGLLATEPAGAPVNRFEFVVTCGSPVPAGCVVAACEGDVNGDNVVDPLDSGYSLARFGCSVGTGDAECDAADANADGIVDPLDVGYILSRFGACE